MGHAATKNERLLTVVVVVVVVVVVEVVDLAGITFNAGLKYNVDASKALPLKRKILDAKFQNVVFT